MSIRPLPPPLQQKAAAELMEEPRRLAADLQHVKDWVAKQPHLRARTDDQWLVAYLRGCKFSLERCKEKLDLYYSLRSAAPELHSVHHQEPVFEAVMDSGVFLILPKLPAPDSPRHMVFRLARFDPDKFTFFQMMSVFYVIQRVSFMDDDNAVVGGQVFLCDLEDSGMRQFSHMTPLALKKIMLLYQDASPLRMKGGHYYKFPMGFETIFKICKTLLNEKNRNRLYVHKNLDKVYECFPRNILPEEYGGSAGTIKDVIDDMKKTITKYSSWLEEDQQFGTDESLRPGKPRTAETMFGVEGSFRKLQVD